MNEYDITPIEAYVLEQRIKGEPFKAIAMDLGIGIGTVARYHYDAQRKLGAKNFRGAVRRWQRWCVTNVEWYTPGLNPKTGIKSSQNRLLVALST